MQLPHTHTSSQKGQNHIGMQLSTVLENYILTQHGGREIATTTVKQQITLCQTPNTSFLNVSRSKRMHVITKIGNAFKHELLK